MASAAILVCRRMAARLTLNGHAVMRQPVMAAGAGPDNIRMAHPIIRYRPVRRGMAIGTRVARIHMQRALTRRYRPVMATVAGAADRRVVNAGDRYPGHGGMAQVAAVRCAHMARRLAGHGCAIMAGHAGLRHTGMVENRR